MTHILIRTNGSYPSFGNKPAKDLGPDFAKTFPGEGSAQNELAEWTDPMKASPDDYWSMPVTVERSPNSTIIRTRDGGFVVQRYDILPHMDGI